MYQLEKFTREDIPQLISWIPDAKTLLIWSGSGYDWPIDRDQLEQTLLKANNSNSKYLLLKFLLDKSVVGYIELRKLDSDEKTARIGRVIIDPNMRGKGLGKEIINTVKEYARKTLDLQSLTLGVFSFNQNAISLYEKTGFIITDTKKKPSMHFLLLCLTTH
ncbi:MAG: GNAT family N-acetyltransferase [Planctomycetia bacterium]|nr:GNAT family N-acetyltransferase [Planctomycetia bacterium]